MLIAYRRHLKKCDHRTEGRAYRRCRCPIWADGFLGQPAIRKSLDTRDWEKAQDKIREWEADGEMSSADADEPITIEQVKNEFIADAEARKLKDATIARFQIIFRQLLAFSNGEGRRFLKELDTKTLM